MNAEWKICFYWAVVAVGAYNGPLCQSGPKKLSNKDGVNLFQQESDMETIAEA